MLTIFKRNVSYIRLFLGEVSYIILGYLYKFCFAGRLTEPVRVQPIVSPSVQSIHCPYQPTHDPRPQ